ncbi:hypothetical protein QBZ16_002119 [Prototheca wickerhamii]|uniref:HVA22-like protein n=1 Tax=Prototheca wickerhamii TaxID=3111 RepID=A0AAD9MI75_PROWI|nr:hypothetical protein QBZ16_002119 [Prototheca wickerhamii]
MLRLIWRFFPTPGLIIRLATFAIGIVYPTANSFLAVESSSAEDDKQWLTYWVVLCTLQVVERLAWIVLAWIPLYSVFRLVLITWLSHPQFKGASLVYDLAIRPLLVKAATVAKEYPAIAKYSKPFLEEPTPAAADKTKKKSFFSSKQTAPATIDEPTIAQPISEPAPEPQPTAPVLFPEVATSRFDDVPASNLGSLAGNKY